MKHHRKFQWELWLLIVGLLGSVLLICWMVYGESKQQLEVLSSPVAVVVDPATMKTATPAPRLPEPSRAGILIHIVEGDTCDVRIRDKNLRVRLKGIDTPERGQPFGKNATKALASFGGAVRVIGNERNRSDRLIADIYSGGDTESINLQLVRDGWAWHYKEYDDRPEFDAAELEAREAKRGLWSRADGREPVAPWAWRKLSKAERDLRR